MKLFKYLLIALVLFAPGTSQAVKYINSIIPESLTIASGATTASTTVSAPTGTYFMLWNGNSTSATTSAAQSFCYLTLSGTTLTATRNTSSTNTCIANATLIDATSSLVTSVQSGTISITTGTSNTATISAVTTADSSVNYLGHSQGNTTFDFEKDNPLLTLTSTTVVTSTVAALTSPCVSSYQVINWNHSALNQATQPFTKSWTNSTLTTTQAITSVNVNNSLLLWDGSNNGNTVTNAEDQQNGQITGATVVTISSGVADTDAIKYAATVVEFISGVFTQNNQRGTTTIAAAASSGTSTITSAATATSSLNVTGWTTTTTAITSFANVIPRLTQTNATTLTSNIGGTVPTGKNVVEGWEMATWQNTAPGGIPENVLLGGMP